jgi:hypothetical protein
MHEHWKEIIMTWKRCLLVTGCLILTIGFAGYLGAEDPEHYEGWVAGVDTVDPEKLQPNWGSGDPISIALQSAAFDGINANHDSSINVTFNGSFKFCGTDCILIAPFNPPNGSIAYSLSFRGYDVDPSGRVYCTLFECSDNAVSCDEFSTFGTDDPFVGGYFSSITLINPSLRFDTSQNTYAIRCGIQGGTIDTRLGNFRIKTYLQISPAPAVATFPDVAPGFWAFQEIEALAASGITQGFPDGTFKPTANVTRAQMATFLARALGLHWPG